MLYDRHDLRLHGACWVEIMIGLYTRTSWMKLSGIIALHGFLWPFLLSAARGGEENPTQVGCFSPIFDLPTFPSSVSCLPWPGRTASPWPPASPSPLPAKKSAHAREPLAFIVDADFSRGLAGGLYLAHCVQGRLQSSERAQRTSFSLGKGVCV